MNETLVGLYFVGHSTLNPETDDVHGVVLKALGESMVLLVRYFSWSTHEELSYMSLVGVPSVAQADWQWFEDKIRMLQWVLDHQEGGSDDGGPGGSEELVKLRYLHGAPKLTQ